MHRLCQCRGVVCHHAPCSTSVVNARPSASLSAPTSTNQTGGSRHAFTGSRFTAGATTARRFSCTTCSSTIHRVATTTPTTFIVIIIIIITGGAHGHHSASGTDAGVNQTRGRKRRQTVRRRVSITVSSAADVVLSLTTLLDTTRPRQLNLGEAPTMYEFVAFLSLQGRGVSLAHVAGTDASADESSSRESAAAAAAAGEHAGVERAVSRSWLRLGRGHDAEQQCRLAQVRRHALLCEALQTEFHRHMETLRSTCTAVGQAADGFRDKLLAEVGAWRREVDDFSAVIGDEDSTLHGVDPGLMLFSPHVGRGDEFISGQTKQKTGGTRGKSSSTGGVVTVKPPKGVGEPVVRPLLFLVLLRFRRCDSRVLLPAPRLSAHVLLHVICSIAAPQDGGLTWLADSEQVGRVQEALETGLRLAATGRMLLLLLRHTVNQVQPMPDDELFDAWSRRTNALTTRLQQSVTQVFGDLLSDLQQFLRAW